MNILTTLIVMAISVFTYSKKPIAKNLPLFFSIETNLGKDSLNFYSKIFYKQNKIEILSNEEESSLRVRFLSSTFPLKKLKKIKDANDMAEQLEKQAAIYNTLRIKAIVDTINGNMVFTSLSCTFSKYPCIKKTFQKIELDEVSFKTRSIKDVIEALLGSFDYK